MKNCRPLLRPKHDQAALLHRPRAPFKIWSPTYLSVRHLFSPSPGGLILSLHLRGLGPAAGERVLGLRPQRGGDCPGRPVPGAVRAR